MAPCDLLAHLLDDDDRRRALNRFRAHLAPAGVLALDVSVPSYPRLGALVEGNGKPEVELERDAGGKLKLRRTAVVKADPANQQLRYHREWLEVGPRGGTKSVGEADLALRWAHRFELELLLRQSDFEILELYGDFERKPFDGTSGNVVVLARPIARPRVDERRMRRRPSSGGRPGPGGRPGERRAFGRSGDPRPGGFGGRRPGPGDRPFPRPRPGGYGEGGPPGYGEGGPRPSPGGYGGGSSYGGDEGSYPPRR